MKIARSPERLVTASAKGMTRRRFMRRAGTTALGAAVTTAYLGRRSDEAKACANPAPCYGAPRCGGHRCNGFQCDAARADTNWSCYGGGQCCGNAGYDNCWEAPGRIRCCDCCAHNAECTTGAPCSGCGSSNWHTCICLGGF